MATMTLANLSKFHARMLRKQGDKVMTVGAYTFTHTLRLPQHIPFHEACPHMSRVLFAKQQMIVKNHNDIESNRQDERSC